MNIGSVLNRLSPVQGKYKPINTDTLHLYIVPWLIFGAGGRKLKKGKERKGRGEREKGEGKEEGGKEEEEETVEEEEVLLMIRLLC